MCVCVNLTKVSSTLCQVFHVRVHGVWALYSDVHCSLCLHNCLEGES